MCLIQVQLYVHYILYFFLDNISYTRFGCYLQPSSGAQLQCTAIGFVWFGVFITLEQVLVWDSFTLKHGQLQTVTVTDRAKVLKLSQYLLQWNKHTNHTKPMAVRCSCAPYDGCKKHPKHVELTLSRKKQRIQYI
jgi:hypothetical protein